MAIFACLFAGLVLRLFWLQATPVLVMIEADSLVRKAMAQRRTSGVLDEGRGRMVDRNGLPLAGIPTNALYVYPKADGTAWQAIKAAMEQADLADLADLA